MKKISICFLLVCTLLLPACDDNADFLKHNLGYEKIGDCSQASAKMEVTANTIGERYVMEKCLDDAYEGQYEVQRLHDTISVNFSQPGSKTALYKITLDINTRPEYNFLTIDGTTFPVRVKR